MYYNARAALHEAGTDCGTTMRSAIKSVAKLGACAETMWPYDVNAVLQQPPKTCYEHADVRSISYQRIDRNLEHLQAALAQGTPFVFAIQCFPEPFTQAQKTGVLQPPPSQREAGAAAMR